MSCNANNVSISPVNVLWQIEAQEVWDFSAATASGLGGTYVTMYLPNGTGYYAWFDENNTDTDPAPGGFTEIEVDYAASASASAIATAFAAAVTAVSGFTATASGTTVTVDRDDVGEVTDATEGTSSSFLSLQICRHGKDWDLGLLQGNIEPTLTPANFPVLAHQSGLTPRALLSKGFEEVSVQTVLLETQASQLKEVYKIYGGVFTPDTSEVFGVGTSKQGTNLLVDAARLILRPVNASDNTTDINFMLALPVPETLVLSGEEPRTLTVTWNGFIDEDIDPRVNVLLFGDASQDNLEA